MGLLDRYIARQYLVNVLVLLVILACFVVTIDASLNIDRYLDAADRLASAEGHEESTPRRLLITVLLIFDLWWPRLLQLFHFMLGLVMVAGMGFTCAQLVRHRELVAVLASGQSLHRVARPILLVGLALTGLQALNQELVLPRIAPLLARDQGDAGKRQLGATSVPLLADGQGRLWRAGSFDADRELLEDVQVWERDESGVATRWIRASGAEWRDGKWALRGGRSVATESHGAERAPEEPVGSIETDLDPTAIKMRRYQGYAQSLGWIQVSQMLAVMDRLGVSTPEARDARERLVRIQWGRVSVMMANVLALLITLPFFLTRVPTNMVVQSLKCAPVAMASLMGGVLGASTQIPGVPAAVSVFVPVMVLLPVAIATTSSVRT